MHDHVHRHCRQCSASALDLSPFTLTMLTEQTAVVTPTNDATPDVVISVREAGTIAVGGTEGCGLSSSASVSPGFNTVTLSASNGDKEYRCTIKFFEAGMHITHSLTHTRKHACTHARTLQNLELLNVGSWPQR